MITVYFSKKAANRLKRKLGDNFNIRIAYNNIWLIFDQQDVINRFFGVDWTVPFSEELTPYRKRILNTYVKYIKDELGGRVRIEYS